MGGGAAGAAGEEEIGGRTGATEREFIKAEIGGSGTRPYILNSMKCGDFDRDVTVGGLCDFKNSMGSQNCLLCKMGGNSICEICDFKDYGFILRCGLNWEVKVFVRYVRLVNEYDNLGRHVGRRSHRNEKGFAGNPKKCQIYKKVLIQSKSWPYRSE
jgi:hypothetical protein